MSVIKKDIGADPGIQELLNQVKRRLDKLVVQRGGTRSLPPDPPRTPLGDTLRSIAATIDALEAISKRR